MEELWVVTAQSSNFNFGGTVRPDNREHLVHWGTMTDCRRQQNRLEAAARAARRLSNPTLSDAAKAHTTYGIRPSHTQPT